MPKKTRVKSYQKKDGTKVRSHLRKKPIRVRTSYNIVTPESSVEGDYAETGWEDEEGTEFDNIDEVVNFLESEGAIQASSSSFTPGTWYESEGVQDYKTGEEKTYNFFIDNASEKQQKKIFEKLMK